MTRATTSKPTFRKNIHQQVTDTIIAQLEAGTIPWQQPWTGSDNRLLTIPKNFTTNKSYRGINILLLWGASITHNYTSDEWGSFLQWQGKKEAIRKGEKGSMIVYYDTLEKENQDGEIENIPFLKTSVVFNRCQLASYTPEEKTVAENKKSLVERFDTIDQFVNNTKAVIKHEGFGACYMNTSDTIYMPEPDSFIDTENCTATEGYYGTLLHELLHWTGHEKRMKRTFGRKFGDRPYAEEELVAELGSAFLCSGFEITKEPPKHHASYIAHWTKVLQENTHCIIAAASQASKAIDYLHTLQPHP